MQVNEEPETVFLVVANEQMSDISMESVPLNSHVLHEMLMVSATRYDMACGGGEL